ncbi:MAG: hypothetical protein H6760_05305 [Candidatus Nomurabacteria bacterium]|nr:MAG: hypothetical protein H6760_05305 [Candidatus Nomurabacteria bacterium]
MAHDACKRMEVVEMAIPCPQRDAIESALHQAGWTGEEAAEFVVQSEIRTESGPAFFLGVSEGTGMRGRWRETNVAVYELKKGARKTDPLKGQRHWIGRKVHAPVLILHGESNACQALLLTPPEEGVTFTTASEADYAAIA